ncbi:MAG: flagellar hook-length control protein FliK, partial [Ignavibacteria bacterium]|nr:flagellar hook-length control protein FliK [Ignavibacteria bacterium]
MNFSNFFIEKLSETESSLALGSKKPATNPFLFQDIIKVFEQENAAQNANALEAGKAEPTLEIFAPTENVIKVSPEKFSSLTQLIASLISQNAELQSTETKHKIENADITKLQFIIPEEKLVELTSKFVDKDSFPLIPLAETANAYEATKPITISYKSNSNKISITIHPIKVDENYTSKVINDEFSFVNKLMVNEGLLQNNPFVVKDDSKLTKQDSPLPEGSIVDENPETVSVEEKKNDAGGKVFYKAEIIKIETPQSETISNFPIVTSSSNTKTDLLNVTMLFQQTEKTTADETVSTNKNTSDLFEGFGIQKPGKLNTASETKPSDGSLNQTVSESTQPPLESNPSVIANSASEVKTELKQETVVELGKSDASKAVVNPLVEKPQSEQNILVGTTKENVTSDKSLPSSLNDLMEGLTDEEKSVFKSFAASGEIKEIKYESTPKNPTDTIKPVELNISSEALPNVKVTQEKSSAVEGKTSVNETIAKDDSTKPAEVKESANVKSLENKEVIAEKSVAQEKSPVVESKTSANVTSAKDELVTPAEVKENVNAKSLENKEVIDEKPVAQEKSPVVEGKTSANITSAKNESAKPIEVKENVSTKQPKNVEAITGKEGSVGKAATEELVSKEKVTVKKEVSASDKVLRSETTKESVTKKVEGRPKLVSKEEFIAAKTLSQVTEPKIATEEKTIFEKVIVPEAKETVGAKAHAALPEVEKKSIEVTSEGKLFVKVSAKASIKVDKSSKEDVETKPQTGNSLSKEVKANDAEHVFQKEEKFITETAKTVSLKSEKGEQVAANVNTEASSSTTKEKSAQIKTEVDSKEQTTVQTKETKHTTEQQANQQSEKENSKSNSSETFKNHLNQVVSSDKNFEVENLKPQVDLKQAHEAFKTVKQHEIMPEFSKLILQGEKQTMTLQLTPENLGKVKLTVDIIENQIVTKIEVENEQVKQFVQSNIEQLKQNMQSAGIPLTNVNVS